MANFEKPSDWSVAPAGSWVSKDALQDHGAPQLGNPAYAEEASEDCDTSDYDEEGQSGFRQPVLAGGRMVQVCPPGQERKDGICVQNPKTEANPSLVAKYTATTRLEDDNEKLDKTSEKSPDSADNLNKTPWKGLPKIRKAVKDVSKQPGKG